MIVKIYRGDDSWTYFDGFDRLTTHKINVRENDGDSEQGYCRDYCIDDETIGWVIKNPLVISRETEVRDSKTNKIKGYRCVEGFDRNGDITSIVYNTYGYILNESGKTIERI